MISIARAWSLSFMLVVAAADAADSWYPIDVDVWDPPFNSERQRRTETYRALDEVSRPWRICVSIPHLKDAYWSSVNFALVDEARRLDVGMSLYEAGGYGNLETQRTQIAECMDRGADALVVSAITADGINDLVARYTGEGRPVIDLINGLSSPAVTARAAVSYWDNGNQAARYLRTLVGDDADPVKVAWFPGPDGANWVAAGDQGFREGIAGSRIEIVATEYGDTGRTTQGRLVQRVLDQHDDVAFVVGTTVTAEAAVTELRKRGLAGQVGVVAYYYSPGVDRGIRRGQIIAAPTDLQAVQARLAMDIALRALEEKPFHKHVAPKVQVIDRHNIAQFDSSTSLPPRGFRPIFSVNEW